MEYFKTKKAEVNFGFFSFKLSAMLLQTCDLSFNIIN
jgi:hypothetical protein